MLALTECHNPAGNHSLQGISAVAVGNPIVDWTNLFGGKSGLAAPENAHNATLHANNTENPHSWCNQPLTVSGLSTIRSGLFRKPEAYFDPFASPLLFFRTPSAELPNEVYQPYLMDLKNEPEMDPIDQELVRKRRSYRKYPPTGFDLVLPHTIVDVGERWVLKDQGAELIEQMRRSFTRSENEASASDRCSFDRSFELCEKEDMGLWDGSRVLEIGQWFGEVLRRP